MKKRTRYNLRHNVSTIGFLGSVTPVCSMHVNPGDRFSGDVGQLFRMAPFTRPLLQDIYVDTYYAYFPYRILFDGWEDFLAAGPNDDTAVTPPPVINDTGNKYLFEVSDTAVDWNQMPQAAYNMFWNEFIRDPRRENPVAANYRPTDPGSDTTANGLHWASSKRHYWNDMATELETGAAATIDVNGSAFGSLTANASDILRAIAEEKAQMKRATYGTRYVDILRSFGVNTNYQMLDRPEIIASSHHMINITDVVSTDAGTSLGTTAGYGIKGGSIRFKRKHFPEHGMVMGFSILRPEYSDPRMKSYFDDDKCQLYESYYDPALEIMPPSVISYGDIVSDNLTNPNSNFGYMNWGEWQRRETNRTHVELTDWTIDQWGPSLSTPQAMTDARIYKARHDWTMVGANIFQDTTVPDGHYQVTTINNIKALRLLPRGNKVAKLGAT